MDDDRIIRIAEDVSYIKAKLEDLTSVKEVQSKHDARIRGLEDWSLVTKVAAFLGAGGTVGGLAKFFGIH